MSDINLLQNQLHEDKSIKNRKIYTVIKDVLFGIFVIFALSVGLIFYLTTVYKNSNVQKSQEVEQKRAELTETIQDKRDDVVRTQGNLASLSQLLDNHIYWTNTFNVLNNSTISGIQFVSVDGTTDQGYITVSGVAKDLPTLATYIQKLNSLKEVHKVELNSSSLSGETDPVYHFSLNLFLDPGIFKYQK